MQDRKECGDVVEEGERHFAMRFFVYITLEVVSSRTRNYSFFASRMH